MLPLPESLLERSFNSQLELNSPASTQNTIAHPINFSFSYPNQNGFMLDGFQVPYPDQLPYPDHQLYNDPMNNTPFDLSRTNNNTQSPNSRSGKRAGRKDRHSKIHTAMGLRDRRMRLSREVAHKFFGLQDMLGFDKASKTVQWLLTKSKTAIREITGGSKGMHSNNENTGCPNNGDCPNSDSEDASTVSDNKLKIVSELEIKTKVKKLANVKAPRKANVHQTLDKEARTKARERARERTKEKQRLHSENLVSSVRLKGIIGEESSSHGYTNYSSSNLINEIEEGSSASVINERAHDYTIGSESNEMLVFNNACGEYGGMSNTDYTYQDQWDIEGSFFGPMQYQSRPW